MNKPKWALNAVKDMPDVSAVLSQNQYIAVKTSRKFDSEGSRRTVKENIGIIIPGRILTPNQSVPVSNIQVFEYGFSKAVFDLCTIEWKNKVGLHTKSSWFNVLLVIISKESEDSFFLSEYTVTREGRYTGSHRQSLENSLPISFKELKSLFGNVKYVMIDDKVYISALTPEQKEAADSLHINLQEIPW